MIMRGRGSSGIALLLIVMGASGGSAFVPSLYGGLVTSTGATQVMRSRCAFGISRRSARMLCWRSGGGRGVENRLVMKVKGEGEGSGVAGAEPVEGEGQKAEAGSVYMVATPIGNMQDMTKRAISILGSADFVVSEDTRRTGTLLKHFDISAKQISHHEHNWKQKAPEILELARNGKSIAVVSDAGTPGISDPGMQLAQMCHQAGVPVRPVPGACAAAAGISVSGMGSGEFLFKGFLAAKGKERKEDVARVCSASCAVVLYEAPHRVVDTLKAIAQTQGSRGVMLGRELTKLHEETFRGTVDEAIEHLQKPGGETRGEFTVILSEVEGGKDVGEEEDGKAREMMAMLINEGVKASVAGRAVAAALGVPKNKAKKMALALDSELNDQDGDDEQEEEEEEEEGELGGALRVSGIDHIVLRAKDPKALEEFYCRVLGCVVEKRNEKAKMSHLRLGASLLDIVHYPSDEEVLSSNVSSLDHFCVTVQPFDPDHVIKTLNERGVETSDAKMRFGAYGDGLSVYFTDCEGNVVEVKGRG